MFPRRAFSTLYKPLKEYQKALDALEDIFPQQKRIEYESALKLYTSRSDPSQFSQEEMKQIFPALFVVGKSFILFANNPNEGSKWFSHAMIFGEKAEPMTDFASYFTQMGDFFSDKNQADLSKKCVDKALEILNTTTQELNVQEKLAKGRALFVKGSLQRGANDLDGAAETLAQSARIFEGFDNSQNTSEFLIDLYELLANIHYQRRDQSQAHLFAVKGLDLIDKTLGFDHIRGNNLARELACTLSVQQNYEEAFVYIKKWENVLVKKHGENDARMIACYFLYGQLCVRLRDFPLALKKFEKIEEMLEKNKNFKFHDSGELFIEKARCHWSLENFEKAKESFNQALEYNRTRFGGESKKLADCFYVGAKTMRDFPELKDEAKECYIKSLEIYRKLGSTCNYEIVSTIANFGHFLGENSEHQEVIKMLPEAIEICKNSLTLQPEMLEACYNVLGMTQLDVKDFYNATINLKAAAKICEETGDATGRLSSHYSNLVLAHFHAKKYEKAQEYGKKILEMDLTGQDSQWITDTLEFLRLVDSKVDQEREEGALYT